MATTKERSHIPAYSCTYKDIDSWYLTWLVILLNYRSPHTYIIGLMLYMDPI
jgi:hypothetical protein